MIHLFTSPAGLVSRILQIDQRFKMLYVRCSLEAKVDTEILQVKNQNRTFHEVGSVPYEIIPKLNGFEVTQRIPILGMALREVP
ncbi:hypothetical protein EVAR_30063_1 [Eumeta japonica]|uniref:Uncharacterized protein n=1 Tax=Eumeta variegata TaxID=151549 RepID=A0A4C1XBJ8_EUMVA|nr:hypothetical protein EVAR_30063_1 [Eumeta japonica]